MTYLQFLEILQSLSEGEFAQFQKRLIPTKYEILGVRTPTMRRLAKQYACELDNILSFPDEYYEVVFIKLTLISQLSYNRFLYYLEYGISLMDNWALCDCFKAKCINEHKQDFLSVLPKLFDIGGEYAQRYVLVILLTTYIQQDCFTTIEYFIARANTNFFYVHMAVAWLLAEILVKEYNFGLYLLNKRIVDKKTHNKGIQKATESFRLTNEQKEFLRSLKIK